jgi:hypothetical protein
MISFSDKDKLLEKALGLNQKFWRVRVSDKKVSNLRSVQGATWEEWSDINNIEERLPEILDELQDEGKFVIVDLKKSEAEKNCISYVMDFTANNRSAGLAGLGNMPGAMMGYNGNIKEIVRETEDRVRREMAVENRLEALEYENQQLRKGKGVQSVLAGIIEKVPPSAIEMGIARLMDSFFPKSNHVIAQGFDDGEDFSNDDDDNDDGHGNDDEQTNEVAAVSNAQAEREAINKKLSHTLKRCGAILQTDLSGTVDFLTALVTYAEANPAQFAMMRKVLNP